MILAPVRNGKSPEAYESPKVLRSDTFFGICIRILTVWVEEAITDLGKVGQHHSSPTLNRCTNLVTSHPTKTNKEGFTSVSNIHSPHNQ
jgi:hypothetical protein